MAQSKILVGLEIGTTKTCMVVGEIRPDATATIIGIGEAKSAGVRRHGQFCPGVRHKVNVLVPNF